MKNITTIILTSFLLSCGSADNGIITSIENELKVTKGKSINLVNATNFKWDRVCIIGPYYSQELQDKTFGFKTQLLATGNDGVSTLAFIKSDNVLTYINHPRNKGDFLNILNNKKCYEYNEIINLK